MEDFKSEFLFDKPFLNEEAHVGIIFYDEDLGQTVFTLRYGLMTKYTRV